MGAQNTSVTSNKAEALLLAICKQEVGPELRPGTREVRHVIGTTPRPSRSVPQGPPGAQDQATHPPAGTKPYRNSSASSLEAGVDPPCLTYLQIP